MTKLFENGLELVNETRITQYNKKVDVEVEYNIIGKQVKFTMMQKHKRQRKCQGNVRTMFKPGKMQEVVITF